MYNLEAILSKNIFAQEMIKSELTPRYNWNDWNWYCWVIVIPIENVEILCRIQTAALGHGQGLQYHNRIFGFGFPLFADPYVISQTVFESPFSFKSNCCVSWVPVQEAQAQTPLRCSERLWILAIARGFV